MTKEQLAELSPLYQDALEKAIQAEPNMSFQRRRDIERTATLLGYDFDEDTHDEYQTHLEEFDKANDR